MVATLSFVIGFFFGSAVMSFATRKTDGEDKAGGAPAPTIPPVFKCNLCGETEGKRGPFRSMAAMKNHRRKCRGWP